MIFKETVNPTIMVVMPIIDGHGENGKETFTIIVNSAMKEIEYIDTHCEGRVFSIGGLSIGAQIVTEVLSQRMGIMQAAGGLILEGVLSDYKIKGVPSAMFDKYNFE